MLFDLDDTLTTYEQAGAEILPQAFDRAGVEPFCSYADLEAVAAAQAFPPDRTHADFWISAFERAAERHGGDPGDARVLYEAFGAVLARDRVEFRPGAAAALESARDGYRVGLVTNGERAVQAAKLSTLGIADAFETAVYVDEVAEPKPAPEPFETALAELAVPADRALYVGDSFHHDVCGAARAGLRVAWCPDDGTTPVEARAAAPGGEDVTPDHTLESLHELADLLR
ncbi:putative hydrolase of the HAD superfamily [Haloarchaeobius iranensis]|uniref:Putative hydrolase of the HAD superfamily n=1 Tax=Haloarchaeobius iranensis TaxID=996166 RepID=A0A1G9SKS0_9EURY|nr:putative hydrolase of the HAD superfamily [Haloarchaeobius iranensis]